jgi:gluconokinase
MGSSRVGVDVAVEPFVLAVDVGSTATRGDVCDATGRPLTGGRVKVEHAFTTADDGTLEIDPDRVADEVGRVIDELAKRHESGRIRGVAIDTFASSWVGVGPDGTAVTPCYTYADSRCAPQVAQLHAELDEAAIQQRTGCRLHASYLTPRFRWLRSAEATPIALPYLSGERSTGWASSARAVLGGVSAGTTPGQLFRGAMEGVAISYSRLAEQLAEASGGFRTIRASGRVTVDLPEWLQVLADVLGVPVTPVTSRRVTLRGTALVAARALASDTATGEVKLGEEFRPLESRGAYYSTRKAWYDRLYPSSIITP